MLHILECLMNKVAVVFKRHVAFLDRVTWQWVVISNKAIIEHKLFQVTLTGLFLCMKCTWRLKWSWFRVLLLRWIMRELCFVAVVGWLKRSVIASGQGGKPVRSRSEWSFEGQTPAELCLLLLTRLTCTSNLPGLPTPQSLSHPSWHCSVALAPVLHRPSCKGYHSCLCLGWANTGWLQVCVRIVSIASVKGLNLEVL